MTLSPATRISPSSAIRTSTPSSGGPTDVDPDARRRVAADDRRRLGLAVALQQLHAEREEEAADLRVERRAARDHRLEPPAEPRAHLVAHQLVEHRVEQPLAERQRLRRRAACGRSRRRCSNRRRFSPRSRSMPTADALVHRLVEPRHRGHDRRPHLDEVGGQRVGALGEIDLRADRDREHQPGGVLVGMRQRQEATGTPRRRARASPAGDRRRGNWRGCCGGSAARPWAAPPVPEV